MILFRWLREVNGKLLRRGDKGRHSAAIQRDTTIRPLLERLEDRVVPADFATTTNVTIAITPNLLGHTASETVTATVVQQGTNTPVTSGTVEFNLLNQQGSVPLNSKGQATFSTSLPLFAVATNQTLLADYGGATVGADTFASSAFLSPVYLNMWNEYLPSQINFGTQPTLISLPVPFNSAYGETDDLAFLSLQLGFDYIDPGRIQTITIDGFSIPGSFSSAFGITQIG